MVDDDHPQGRYVRSANRALQVTSASFSDLRSAIEGARGRHLAVQKSLDAAKRKRVLATTAMVLSYPLIVGFFWKAPARARQGANADIEKLASTLEESGVVLDFGDDAQIEATWEPVRACFAEIMRSQHVWDVTFSKKTDQVVERTVATSSIQRTPISRRNGSLTFIECSTGPLFLPNTNGPDIFIFPTFLILYKGVREFGIFDLKETMIEVSFTDFVETDSVPKDSQVVGYTWLKANKDGSMDRRFANNKQIPMVRYGTLSIGAPGLLDEQFQFSSTSAFQDFADAILTHGQRAGWALPNPAKKRKGRR
jgi:hypothetical protein